VKTKSAAAAPILFVFGQRAGLCHCLFKVISRYAGRLRSTRSSIDQLIDCAAHLIDLRSEFDV
jgi:hypothetical protein